MYCFFMFVTYTNKGKFIEMYYCFISSDDLMSFFIIFNLNIFQ